MNKANGEFKYVPATGIDIDKEVVHIQQTADTLEENRFERCFDAVRGEVQRQAYRQHGA